MTSVATTTSEEAGQARRPWLDRLALGYLAFVGVYSAWASYASFRDRLRVPVLDDWRILDDFHSMSLLQWLVSNQNGHRPTFTFGLLALDYHFFDGRQDLLVVATLATAWLVAAGLFLALRSGGGLATPLARIAFGFAWFLVFWSGAAFVFLWGVCHGNVIALLWLVLSLWCLVASVHPQEPSVRGWRLPVLACLGAFFATFSVGQGVAAWVALIAVAWVARLGARNLGLLMAGLVVTLVVYTRGLEAGGSFSLAASAGLLFQPLALLGYLTTFLGSVLARAAEGLGLVGSGSVAAVGCVLGSIGLLASASFAFWLLRRPSRADRRELLALGIMTFAVAAAGVVALARVRFDLAGDPLAPRFVNWSATFWIGAVLAVPSRAGRARGAVLALLIAALTLCLVPGLAGTRETLTRIRSFAEEASLGVLLGIPDRRLADRMSALGDTARFNRVTARLEQDRRGFFADPWAALPDAPLVERFEVVSSERCRGDMRLGGRFGVRAAGGVTLRGQAEEGREKRAPALVVVTDGGGIIRGLGSVRRPPRPSPDAAGRHPWSGYLRGFDASAAYVAFAVLADGRSACPLRAMRPAK